MARKAVEHGVDGIVVSNHGARQLDGVPATVRCCAFSCPRRPVVHFYFLILYFSKIGITSIGITCFFLRHKETGIFVASV